MAKEVLDFETGEKIGVYLNYKGDSGPCIYGKTEFKPDETFKQRCLAAIASRESPIRDSKNPGKARFPLKPGYSSTQAYEPWISIGMCHAISKNGNAQKLIKKLVDEVPSSKDKLSFYGYGINESLEFTDSSGTVLTIDEIRSEKFCVSLHKVLEEPETIPVQVDFFWKLIEERFPIVEEEGWMEAAMEDERIMLIIASLSINAGIKLFKACLSGAEELSAECLTESRIKQYKRIGSDFGVDRSLWEAKCDYVTDEKPVVL